jgi:peptidoglycan/LPS O-acetylase OafA/YrhL
LDRLRIVTAVSVVMVHTLTYTAVLDTTPLARLTQMGFLTAFHFTREIFMFITALALVYVYAGKPFDTRRFWKKRAIGVLIPYVAWSLIYQLMGMRTFDPLNFIGVFLFNVVTGSASFQLYYILLTLEFYIIFPWFLGILPRLARRPWLTLAVAIILELLITFAVNAGLPLLHLPAATANIVALFFDRFAPVYLLYFVMGGLAALYLPQIKAFLARWGWWALPLGLVGTLILEGHFLYANQVQGIGLGSAVSVLQPAMVPFGVAIIVMLYWLSLWSAQRAKRLNALRSTRVWHELSDSAFGVYLVHPIFLTDIFMLQIIPHIKSWPTALLVLIVWAGSAVCSIALTLLLLRIPLVSRLMGREGPAPAWLISWRDRLSVALGRLTPGGGALNAARNEKEVVGETD